MCIKGKPSFRACRGFEMNATLDQFTEVIHQAIARRRPLRIRGSGSKDFYGGLSKGEVLDTMAYRGIEGDQLAH